MLTIGVPTVQTDPDLQPKLDNQFTLPTKKRWDTVFIYLIGTYTVLED